jgi:hypothetical protein
MNSINRFKPYARRAVLLMTLLFGFAHLSTAADFSVSTPGDEFVYLINGTNNSPTITLVRGKTYTFDLNCSDDHPFAIGTDVGFPAPPGVSGANGLSTGTITYAVPLNATNCVYYCVVHDFSGLIQFVDAAPTPPAVKIVGITVGTNIALTMQQTTTNGFSFIPEANTNLTTTNWFALTVQSNKFANGTNQIWCGKPIGNNVGLRIRAK